MRTISYTNDTTVKDKLKEQLESFIRLTGRTTDRNGHFQCPNSKAHTNGDKDPSAYFVKGSNNQGWACLCGSKGDIFTAYEMIYGKKPFSEMKEDLASMLHIQAEEKPTIVKSSRNDYFEDTGKLEYYKQRLDLSNGKKTFCFYMPDGKKGLVEGQQHYLYNLPEIIKYRTSRNIFICEGEKCVDALKGIGLVATSTDTGAGKWDTSYNKYFQDASVIVLTDNDEPGRKHGELIAKNLKPIAKSLKVILLPGLKPKGDVFDWLQDGHTKAELIEIVKSSLEWEPIQELPQDNPKVKEPQQEEIEQEEPWELPIPFDVFNLPSFPTNCFPDWVAEYVEAVAEDTQTPEDMAAVVTLGILTIPCNKVYKVEGKPGWQEPTSLYCTTIAKPGERKSSIMSHITKPIYEYEAEENERLKGDIARNQTERKILEGEVDKLKNIASKDNSALNRAAALDKAEELSQFEDIRQVRFTCDDVSPEKLAGMIADNNGRMAIVSAEGGIFDIMNGRYSQTTNIDVFLKGHAGDPLRVDRVGRPSEYISEPALSLVIAIQPDVLTGIMSNSSFRGRGLTARFLYSIPSSKVGARNVESTSIPEYVKSTYCRNIRSIIDVKVPEKPYILNLSRESRLSSIEFAKELEPRLIDDLENIADWASKLHGAILRIAGILHVAEHVDKRAWEYDISEETFNNALTIGKYFIEHAKAAFALMGADKNIDDCKHVIKWFEKEGKTEFSKRDILRGNRRFKDITELEPVLKLLCEYGYLREFEKIRQGAVKKPDKFYKVNPLFYTSLIQDTRDRRDTRMTFEVGTAKIDNACHVSHVSHTETTSQNDIQEDILSGDVAIEFLRNGGTIEI